MDVVGSTDEGDMIVGECKFTNASLDCAALGTLEDRAGENWLTPTGG